MSKQTFRINVNKEEINKLYNKYGEQVVDKTMEIVNKYTTKVASESKEIIDDYGYRDIGDLINSIKISLLNYQYKITGTVGTNMDYAAPIHDGAKNVGGTIQPFFIPFVKAPSLYQWALRNGVIETIDGVDRLVSTGQVVYPDRGGLMVKIYPTKFFEKPFEDYKDKFVKDMEGIIDEL